jgi:glucan biosynthesis protein
MKQHGQERKELFALAAWLQTFPEFTSSIYIDGNESDEDAERLLSLLDSSDVTLYVFSIMCIDGCRGITHK